jgi:hypothetical protein
MGRRKTTRDIIAGRVDEGGCFTDQYVWTVIRYLDPERNNERRARSCS